MILKLTKQDEITIAEFVDGVTRFTLSTCDDVKTELRPLLKQTDSKVIFDLHNIGFIDSSGIGYIIALFKTAKGVGSTLKLCNLTPEVLEIFKLLHLQVVFDITGTRTSCLKDMLSST